MDLLWWVVATTLCSAITGGLIYFVMHSHSEVQMAKQREELAAARAILSAQQQAIQGSLEAAQISARSEALNDFMADIRIEERHYIREHKAFFLTKKSVVRQERIFFRNLPLSNWIEQEMPIEEGADAEELAKTMAVFVPDAMLDDIAQAKPRRLLRS